MGAGMGCPDWPKCFGEYIPPTSAEGLPEDYQDTFREERISKNKRLAGLFEKLGYDQLSKKITEDPAVLYEQEFDATKAWIEYINRLVGVLIGLFVFANMILSFGFRKQNKWIPIIGVSIFVLTGFQGWVGSLVVSTNLLHGFITFHMLLALLILGLLIIQYVKAKKLSAYHHKALFITCIASLVMFIPQIILGTEVRGVIDDLLVSNSGRETWTSYLSANFLIHRSYSWLILIGSLIIFYYARKSREVWIINTSILLIFLVFFAMVAGISMTNFAFPFWLQPLHLIIAVGIFSTLFYLILRVKLSK